MQEDGGVKSMGVESLRDQDKNTQTQRHLHICLQLFFGTLYGCLDFCFDFRPLRGLLRLLQGRFGNACGGRRCQLRHD